jgi:hypothetical protein
MSILLITAITNIITLLTILFKSNQLLQTLKLSTNDHALEFIASHKHTQEITLKHITITKIYTHFLTPIQLIITLTPLILISLNSLHLTHITLQHIINSQIILTLSFLLFLSLDKSIKLHWLKKWHNTLQQHIDTTHLESLLFELHKFEAILEQHNNNTHTLEPYDLISAVQNTKNLLVIIKDLTHKVEQYNN